jgi:hypothetical protein
MTENRDTAIDDVGLPRVAHLLRPDETPDLTAGACI